MVNKVMYQKKNNATPRHATKNNATPRHATPPHATPCHAMPRHATPCHATLATLHQVYAFSLYSNLCNETKKQDSSRGKDSRVTM